MQALTFCKEGSRPTTQGVPASFAEPITTQHLVMKVPLGSPMFPCALWTPLSRQTLFFPPCQCQEPITEQW